ncbi:MAG: hypothetical protein HKP02_10505 [Xanthomonadales bacterium]|nr:hypothetical protein [Xanthomonadales bacterium]
MSIPARESPIASQPGASAIEAFEAGTLDPTAFDHEAHVHIAWSLLEQDELPAATVRYSSALRRLTRKWGVEEKYHETITVFFMALIAERRAARPGSGWPNFKASNRDLVEAPQALLNNHYSGRRLQSELARNQFLLPDRSPIGAPAGLGPSGG